MVYTHKNGKLGDSLVLPYQFSMAGNQIWSPPSPPWADPNSHRAPSARRPSAALALAAQRTGRRWWQRSPKRPGRRGRRRRRGHPGNFLRERREES